jgi:hypothetical protein
MLALKPYSCTLGSVVNLRERGGSQTAADNPYRMVKSAPREAAATTRRPRPDMDETRAPEKELPA